ncbi:MAG: tetratricopeptide repeat protein [Acidobacteriota bacterium]|nr:tetratricopeptide repeat protein [Acidobacteriota bacterium]
MLHSLAFGDLLSQHQDGEDASQSPSRDSGSTGRLESLLQQATSFLQSGDLSSAERTARIYLKTHANSADGHFLLGNILFRETKPKESLAEYTEAARFHDPSAFDLKVVALDYVLLGDYADADKWFTKSLQGDPKDSQAWYYLGRTKYNESKLEDAVGAFRQCLKLEPKNVKAEDNLGLSYEGLGRTEEGITAYKTAIAWQAQSLDKTSGPFIDLGALLMKQNRSEEALPYLQQAVEVSPKDARAYEYLGKAYSDLNQMEEAQKQLEKAVTIAPQSARLHFILGQIYRKEGLTQKAKMELERASQLNGLSEPTQNSEP